MSLENEKERMWGILRSDPKYIAHYYAQELLTLSKCKKQVKFHHRCNELLDMIMNTIQDPMDVIAIVKCWLSQYQLPMDPAEMPAFDRFHQQFGVMLTSTHFNTKDIPVL